MQKIDRLGWAVGFSLRSYGVRIGIRSNDAACLERVSRHLPHDWETSAVSVVDRVYSILIGGAAPNFRRFNLLYGDHVRLARSMSIDDVFETLESDLRLLVAEFAPRRVFVHAGVVSWKGRAIVVPGRSFSGKSTLIAELVRAGAVYYSDEYAVFDRHGRVHPFPKPLEIRDTAGSKQRKVDVKELGSRVGTRPVPVGLVVMTSFKEGAHWRPERLSPGKGVLSLFANTISARRKPEQAFAALEQVTKSAPVLKGVRGEAKDVALAILKRVEQLSNV